MSVNNWVILIGVLIVGMIFILASQGVIFGWMSMTEEDIQKGEAEQLVSLVQRAHSDSSKNFYYCYESSPVNITIEDGILIFERSRFEFSYIVPKRTAEINLTDITNICILKEGDVVKVDENVTMRFCTVESLCKGAPESVKDSLGKDCCPSEIPVCTKSHCCPTDKPKWCNKPKDGSEPRCMNETEYKDNCEEEICPSSISQCFNHWHWSSYDGTFYMNINGYVCDYYEVCHPDVVPIAKEIIECCNNRCSGNCHSMCNQALSDSGLSSTETDETKKKCYGFYTIYGLDDAARWMQGYQIHVEEPATVMLAGQTWMCTGYSIVLTTLLRSVGYGKDEVYSLCGPGHAYNLVKFPGESQYRFADTVGNSLYISGITGSDWYRNQYGACRTSYECGCQNDEGMVNCPSPSNIILGASC